MPLLRLPRDDKGARENRCACAGEMKIWLGLIAMNDKWILEELFEKAKKGEVNVGRRLCIACKRDIYGYSPRI